MKQLKRSGVYKAANVIFDPHTTTAVSYDWWVFVKVIKGRVIFNNYNYSRTTRKHQWKVKLLMKSLGIKIDSIIETRSSLSNIDSLKELNSLHREEMKNQAAAAESKRIERNRKARERRATKQSTPNADRLRETGHRIRRTN